MKLYQIFLGNSAGRSFRTKRAALARAQRLQEPPQITVALLHGDRISRMWDQQGHEMQFISHGGDQGEWR